MPSGASLRILNAALALDQFTVSELADHSDECIATVRTALHRNPQFFHNIGVDSTGKRGGQTKRYVVREEERGAIVAHLDAALPRQAFDTGHGNELLDVVLQHLGDIEAGHLKSEHRAALIAFCEKKLATVRTVRGATGASDDGTDEIIQSAQSRLDDLVLTPQDISIFSDRLRDAFITKSVENATVDCNAPDVNVEWGNISSSSKAYLLFDMIDDSHDTITTRAFKFLSGAGCAVRIALSGIRELSEATSVVQNVQAAFHSIGKKNIDVSMIATMDGNQGRGFDYDLACSLLRLPSSMTKSPGRRVVLDQSQNPSVEQATWEDGGTYLADSARKPLEKVLRFHATG